ncbi:NTP transferase domain-containing protein [uncultured Spirosoma sp.]|uniref:NTP transferase domain-containing protein n=1 Tax=uncultured Spirosoma sp. TaxID=278208 RepID=UPI00258ABEFB|nr:NTP transferase domain-containing protein [uncultured Spirosoma sp.]
MTSTETSSTGDSQVAPLNGLVLIGGRSLRMGQDKAQLVYYDKPQRDHLTELLRPYCQTVYWSVNAEQIDRLQGSGIPLLGDVENPRPGPLNGILAALNQDPTVAWLVVACDMPLLTDLSLRALVAGRNPACLATAFYDTDGRYPEPLLCIWEPASGPVVRDAFNNGMVSPRKLLMLHSAALLPAPDPRELTNVNSPAERNALGF